MCLVIPCLAGEPHKSEENGSASERLVLHITIPARSPHLSQGPNYPSIIPAGGDRLVLRSEPLKRLSRPLLAEYCHNNTQPILPLCLSDEIKYLL